MSMRAYELDLQLHHRHADGSWAELEAVPAHDDPAQHDPERGWGHAQLFRCRTCEETLTVVRGELEPPGEGIGG